MNFVALLIGIAAMPHSTHFTFAVRRKPKRVTLPTLRFIRIANQKVLKRHRLRRLLLIRMLLLAITAIAMARPTCLERSI